MARVVLRQVLGEPTEVAEHVVFSQGTRLSSPTYKPPLPNCRLLSSIISAT
jgi:hypothetical protein